MKSTNRFDPKPTVWKMWRCEMGAQWISSADWTLTKQELTGHCDCPFSHTQDHGLDFAPHKAEVVGTTTDREEAGKWFTRGESTLAEA